MIGDEVKHYCWIKHFSRLVRSQYTGAHGEHAYCRFCLHGFYGKAIPGQCTRLEDAKRRRDEHEKECFRHGGQKTSFPEEPFVEFKAIQKQVVTLFNFFHFRTNRWKYLLNVISSTMFDCLILLIDSKTIHCVYEVSKLHISIQFLTFIIVLSAS